MIASLSNQAPFTYLTCTDRIAFLIPNSYEFIVTFLAITHARAASAPLNPAYTESEIKFYFEDIQPKFAVVLRGFENAQRVSNVASQLGIPLFEVWGVTRGQDVFVNVGWVAPTNGSPPPTFLTAQAPAREVPQGSDVALFLHTSGTTSRPKGTYVPFTPCSWECHRSHQIHPSTLWYSLPSWSKVHDIRRHPPCQ